MLHCSQYTVGSNVSRPTCRLPYRSQLLPLLNRRSRAQLIFKNVCAEQCSANCHVGRDCCTYLCMYMYRATLCSWAGHGPACDEDWSVSYETGTELLSVISVHRTPPPLTCTTCEHNRCTTCYIFRHCLSAIFAAERASAEFTFSARAVCSIHCSSHHARYAQHYNCEHYVNGVTFMLSPSTAASPYRQPASVGHPVAAAVFGDTINGTLRV